MSFTFKNLAMRKKLLLSLVPTLFCALLVSIQTFLSSRQDNPEVNAAIRMTEIIGAQELAMVRMSEALRGYLLNPADTQEFDRKKQADADYVALTNELAQLTLNNPDIQALNKKMAEFDASTLDEKENQVADLIKNNGAALAFYQQQYTPARLIQVENFNTLKTLVKDHSQQIILNLKQKNATDAWITISFLWLGMIIGQGLTAAISLRLTSRTEEVVTHINKVSLTVAHSSKAIMGEAGKLSEAAQRQATAIQQTAASINEISLMIRNNSESAEDSLRHSKSCREQVEVGQKAFSVLLQSIDGVRKSQKSIFDQVEKSNQGVAEITGIINQIEEKTRVINDIVFQTKLLSFNASVEAARAGEHGKGFAVVAEEVGNLARMSGGAAQEITGLLSQSTNRVNGIIQATRDSVKKTIDDAAHMLDSSIKNVNAFEQVLAEITNGVTGVDAKVDAISTASREQDSGVAEISKVMKELDADTQKNAMISQRAANNAQKLSDQAENLEELVLQMTALLSGSQVSTSQAAPAESEPGLDEDIDDDVRDRAA